MFAYVIRRLLQGGVVLFLVTFITFGLLQAAPGDPLEMMLGEGQVELTEEQRQNIRESWGLDRPWYEQYLSWLRNFATGDLGESIMRPGTPVGEMITSASVKTIQLTTLALGLALITAIPAGLIAAIKRYSIFDSGTMVWASAGVSLPNFWVGLMLIILFSLYLGWLPPFGSAGWKAYVLPVFTLAINETAILARMMRGSMLEVLDQDYVMVARAKGLAEYVVILAHATRNAMLPIVTVIGLRLAFILSGTIVVEAIFAWGGLGTLLIDALYRFDYQVVQAIVILLTTVVIVANIVTDLLYAVIDPRIRLNR